MTDNNSNKDVNLGMFDRPKTASVLPGDLIAGVLSVAWVMICLVFFLFARRPESGISFDAMNFVITVLAVLLPIAMIWVAAVAARSVTVAREESMRLQASIDILRQNYVDLAQSKRLQVSAPTPQAQAPAPTGMAAPSNAVQSTHEPAPQFTSQRDRPAAVAATAPAGTQGDLALGIPAAGAIPTLTAEDFIRALNFPKTADDAAGFRSLRKALKDPRAGRLVQASQDVLTLLSQDGVYMDDLIPDRARPDIWRKFAEGQRGQAIAMLGGIRDRTSLSNTARRMREDHIFRDTAHHFLRQFDMIFAAFSVDATDAEIAALSDTRTARAFMLIGRVAGTFD